MKPDYRSLICGHWKIDVLEQILAKYSRLYMDYYLLTFIPSFEYSTHNRTRGHSRKLNKKRSQLDLRQHFFSERVVNIWNSLDNKTVTATSLNCFKSYLDIVQKDGFFLDFASLFDPRG